MNWGGIIAGALGGGAQAASNIARDQRLLDNSQTLAKFQADLDVDKAQRVADLQMAMDLKRLDTSTPNSYGSQAIGYKTAETKATEGVRTDAEVDRETKLAPIRTQSAVAQATAINEANANSQIKLAKNPDYMAAVRSLKQAQESSASLAQAALARLQVSKLQGDQALLDELAKARASGNEDAVQAAQQKITDRAYTGKDTAKAYAAYTSANTKLIDLETKLNDPTKMLEPAAVASLKQEIQEARLVQQQAMKEMGIKVPKAPSTEEQAIKDAQTAVATGKISLQDANKRLTNAGFKPLPNPAAPPIPQKPNSGGVISGAAWGPAQPDNSFGWPM
jgi:hypothetical protein